jgi:hypothetical protein
MEYQPVGRIDPVTPSPSLLTSARRMRGIDWSTGIQWTPVCQPSDVAEYCSGGTNRTAAIARATEHVVPFTIYTPLACDRFAGGVNLADLPDAARALTEVHTAKAIAEALWLGRGLLSSDTTIPTLRNASFDVGANATADLDDAVAQLLVHYEIASDGEGGATIHMPSELAVYALGGGAGGARICWPEGDFYRGPLGSVVVPGPGYPNGQSATGAGGYGPGPEGGPYLGNAANEAWLYVTGPVEWDAEETVRVLPEAEADRTVGPARTNLYEVWGERRAIVRFDPCKAFATKVTNPAPLPEVS